MQFRPASIVLLLLSSLTGIAHAANFTVSVNSNNRFSPSTLTIQVGDSVTWTNSGGIHNVRADNGSFRCANGCDGEGGDGNPASNSWSFTRTFNAPGTIAYNCEVHAFMGMRGTIIVEPVPTGNPGNLRFSTASRQIAEGAGSVTLTVERTGGDDGAVSVDYATSNGSATAGSDYTAKSGTLSWDDNDDAPKTFEVTIEDDTADEANETFNVALSNPDGGAGLSSPSSTTVTLQDDDQPAPQNPGELGFTSSSYQANEGSGNATLQVERSGGSTGAVSVDYATSDGSATAGSDYASTSGNLSWSDGDAATKSFTVPLLDDTADEPNETLNLTLADPTGGAVLGRSSATLTVGDNDQAPTGPCVPGDQTLCLSQGGRFKVEVSWRNFEGVSGQGFAVDIGRLDSGLFYFFDSNNIEMLAKVLNACSLSGFNNYWVFFAATTNVEFTLTVTDTEANRSKQYTNPLGRRADAVLDTAAFATCP